MDASGPSQACRGGPANFITVDDLREELRRFAEAFGERLQAFGEQNAFAERGLSLREDLRASTGNQSFIARDTVSSAASSTYNKEKDRLIPEAQPPVVRLSSNSACSSQGQTASSAYSSEAVGSDVPHAWMGRSRKCNVRDSAEKKQARERQAVGPTLAKPKIFKRKSFNASAIVPEQMRKRPHAHVPPRGSRSTAGFTASLSDKTDLNTRKREEALVRIRSTSVLFSKASSDPSVGQTYDDYLKFLVTSMEFDYMCGLFIVANALTIGVQADYAARNSTDQDPLAFQVLEKVFCLLFLTELCLRVLVYGRRFFSNRAWKWNIFDCFVVGLQVSEEIVSLCATEQQSSSQNFSALRVMRILRLVRIIRLVRVLRLIGELRTIVVSIMGSMKALFWTVCLLMLIIYIIAVYLTQLISDHKVANRDIFLSEQFALEQYYGSLFRSVLTLYQSITGGLNWESVVEPLIDHLSPWLAFLFSFYIAFALLALMNVVTGVFVESALQTAKQDKDLYLLHHVRRIFLDVDVNQNGVLTWEDFESALSNPQMSVLFEAVDLDMEEALELFQLIDVEETGKIDLESFVNSFFQFRGSAKSLDLAMLSFEMKRHNRLVQLRLEAISEAIACCTRPLTPPSGVILVS